MKSFLQTIGVLQKDTPAASVPVPETTASSAVAVEPAKAVVVAESVEVTEPVSSNINRDEVETLKERIRQDIKDGGGISPLIELLDSVNRLHRIRDPKDRLLTAIDLVGYPGHAMLGFAERYNAEAERSAARITDTCNGLSVEQLTPLKRSLEAAELRVNELREQLILAEESVSTAKESIEKISSEASVFNSAIVVACQEVVGEFTELHSTMKEAFVEPKAV